MQVWLAPLCTSKFLTFPFSVLMTGGPTCRCLGASIWWLCELSQTCAVGHLSCLGRGVACLRPQTLEHGHGLKLCSWTCAAYCYTHVDSRS